MKKLLVALFLTLFIPTQIAEAHVLKTDGAIGAVLHVNPEDDPIAQEESQLYFEFKDRNNTFSVNDCDCRVTVTANDKEIYREQLINDTFSFVFPEKNLYFVTLYGSPKDGSLFESFTLTYDIRVSRETTKENGVPDTSFLSQFTLIHYVLFLFLIVTIGTLVLKNLRSRR